MKKTRTTRRAHPLRPRKRAGDRSPSALKTAKLLAGVGLTGELAEHDNCVVIEALIAAVGPSRSAKALSRRLISRFSSLSGVVSASVPDLREIKGLSESQLAIFRLVRMAAIQLTRAEIRDRPIFSTWAPLLDYLHVQMSREPVEQFRVLYLDSRNHLLLDELQTRGTVNHTIVYPREVIKRALEINATAMLLVHNHPSGDPKPSESDVEMTMEVQAAAKTVGMAMHDHVIVGNGKYFSFLQSGLLQSNREVPSIQMGSKECSLMKC